MRNAARFSHGLVVCLAFAMVILNTGIWPMPNLYAQYLVSQNLNSIPFSDPGAQYIFTNYFMPALFKMLGGKTLLQYGVYALCVSCVFLGLFIRWFIHFHGVDCALDKLKLLPTVMFPVFMLPFYWVGMDGMVLLLMLLIMTSFQKNTAFIPAFLLGIQHFEQGMIAFSIMMATVLAGMACSAFEAGTGREQARRIFFILVAVIAGKLSLLLLFNILNIDPAGNRSNYLMEHLPLYLSMWSKWYHTILWSLLGVGWVVVFTRIRRMVPLLTAVLLALVFTAIVGDQTRVGAILLFPSLFYWVLQDRKLWRALTQKFVVISVCLYFILPVIVVWGGPHGDLLRYDLKLWRLYTQGQINASEFDWLMPFRADAPTTDVATPLSDYRASLTRKDSQAPVICTQNEFCTVALVVQNAGSEPWPAALDVSRGNSVNLAYHIESPDGSVILQDGIRTPLPYSLAAGESMPLTLILRPGLEPGSYIIAADMVHEGITWFGDKNESNMLRFGLEIE